MNHKQKLGYMALGAGILAVGIMIGQFVTPDIEAQSNGVFDEITCRKLTVIDKVGKDGIVLDTSGRPGRNYIAIFNPHGNEAFTFSASRVSTNLFIYSAGERLGVGLSSAADMNLMFVNNPVRGINAFRFHALPQKNELIVYDKSSGAGVGFYTDSNEAKQTRFSPPKYK